MQFLGYIFIAECPLDKSVKIVNYLSSNSFAINWADDTPTIINMYTIIKQRRAIFKVQPSRIWLAGELSIKHLGGQPVVMSPEDRFEHIRW